MPQLLLELFSEDIPARMQAGAARDLERLARAQFAAAEVEFGAVDTFAGLRRLTLAVEDLPATQEERVEERKGPRIGAPDAAMQGFLRSAGVGQVFQRDGLNFARIVRPGRPTAQIIAQIVPAIVRAFPWPKSMTWGSGSLRWVRPLQRIVCLFDGAIVPFEIDGLGASDVSEGHRFMGDTAPFVVRDLADYRQKLADRFTMLDAGDRRQRILVGAQALCAARGLTLVADEGLLDEVTGMADWPVPILGDMDAAFLDLPPEVIRTSMRSHQRYFAVRDTDGALAAHFVTVANIETADGGALIAAGNSRVLSARLNDARFFWDEDRKSTLESRLDKLKGVTFHAKLGTMAQRVERLEALAAALAPMLNADPGLARQAGRLAKADLVTHMVREFPELQGIMGGYYAQAEGLDGQVAAAIRDHYRPQGPTDLIPQGAVARAVALGDKLDTLASFFAIGEKPTGSRDPFALRRAALGIIRTILGHGQRLSLSDMIALTGADSAVAKDLMAFFCDRLKVMLRDEGRRHDLVDAVFALGDDDLVRVVARIDALAGFLGSEDGANLLAGYRRASNILAAEAKKSDLPTGTPSRVAHPAAESALFDALQVAGPKLSAALAREDFPGALTALAGLRGPVDSFFDKVLVNSKLADERDNRLRLLEQVRQIMGQVADFSFVSG